MILALNTAQRVHEMAILEGGKILLEKSWADQKNDVETLVPILQGMIEELGVKKKDIKQIVVVRGPGSFTSVRTGVAFANALAEGLKAKLYSLDTFELLRRKVGLENHVIPIVHAGGLDIALRGDSALRTDIAHPAECEIKVGPLSALLADFPHNQNIAIVSELPETLEEELSPICVEKGWKQVKGHELQTLGEAMLTYRLEGLEQVDTVEPFYLKEPKITKSSDPWKR